MKTKIDYDADMQIDETALDVEWLDQPMLMMRFVRHTAQVNKELDLAKERLDIARAELDKEARTNSSKFNIEKITEAAVQSAIILSKDYQTEYKLYIDAKYEADMAKGALRALEQRKDALENLVRLNGQQYFAGPKVPRNLSEERKLKDDKVNEMIGTSMRTKRKKR